MADRVLVDTAGRALSDITGERTLVDFSGRTLSDVSGSAGVCFPITFPMYFLTGYPPRDLNDFTGRNMS